MGISRSQDRDGGYAPKDGGLNWHHEWEGKLMRPHQILVAAVMTCAAFAQAPAAAPDSTTIPLWAAQPPGAKIAPGYTEERIEQEQDPICPRISKVSTPTLEVFLPAGGGTARSAVVICPGGGYGMLAYGHEGLAIARWFAARGIAGIILKYRLPSDLIMQNKTIGPLQDVQEAIRVVRRHTREWRIDSSKIGVMGFSAGGHLACSAATRFAEKTYEVSDGISARPDFCILVYPVVSMQEGLTHMGSRINLLGETPTKASIDAASGELRATANTPPAFLIHSQDDGAVPVENSLRLFQKLTTLGVPAELHVYPKGGHGYGLGTHADAPIHWPGDLEVWLKNLGVLHP
jgi:acetyl esterase/lipase